MPLSYNSIVGGSSNASNDFTVNVGTSGHTNVTLSTSFPAGSYICTSSLSDTSLDIYLINEDGTSAGYANATTATTSITASKTFNKVVIYGGANNDTLTFQFKYVFAPSDATNNVTAAPRFISLSPSGMPNTGNTTTVTGQNFATDITATFVGTDNVNRSASVSRTSATSLTVTRPATLPELYSPYTIVLENPGIANPTSTNVNKGINLITTKPSPPIIGTATGTGNTTATLTFTAPANNGGVSITSYTATSSPGGITSTLNQSGSGTFNFTGLTPGTSYTFTVTATNANGTSSESSASNSITLTNTYTLAQTYNATSTYTVPSGTSRIAAWVFGAGSSGNAGGNQAPGGNGGSGGGLVGFKEYSVTPGQSFTVTIGNAGGTTSFGNLATASGNSGSSNVTGHVSQSGGAGGAGGSGNDSANRIGSAGGSINNNISLSFTGIDSYGASGGGGGGARALDQHASGSGGAGGTPRGGHGGSSARVAAGGHGGDVGGAGTVPGGGGGGGGGGYGGFNAGAGGTGAAGRVIVYEFR